ncbi:MAG: hypothetical protein ABEH58_01370 [Haloplanus sp.]
MFVLGTTAAFLGKYVEEYGPRAAVDVADLLKLVLAWLSSGS